jgi:hypothetical protein
MRAGVSAGSQPKGFSELKGVNHRFFTQIMPMNPGAGIYESADNRNPGAGAHGPPEPQKKPRLSVGAAMKRMEKLLLDSKKHLKFLPLYFVLV